MFVSAVIFSSRASAAGIPLPPPLPELESPDPKQAELGKILFFDRRLSGDGTVACATCHIPQEEFADSQPLSGAYPTNRHWRHTLSLLNVGYLKVFFWDGRGESLDEQALAPLHSPFEMNLHPDYLVARLEVVPEYRRLFDEAFEEGLTRQTIFRALAAFERTLVVDDSPFDRHRRGEDRALSPEALRGAEIFFGPRGGCARCHTGALLSDQKFHNTGVGETADLKEDPLRRATRAFFLRQMGLQRVDRDPGRYAVTRAPEDLGAFRTPPLRQVAETAPYMHNGSLATLEEVVDFYGRGGGDDPNRSPLLTPLNLRDEEKAALLAFLRSLTGSTPEIEAPPPGI